MNKISKRLFDITNHLNKDETIIDIGCDHGLLAIYLIKNNYYDNIYISDNKKTALNSAINNVNKFNLEDKITCLLGDGLTVINDKSINTIILSGLGTHTIIKILTNYNIKQINKIVIQSNNHHEKLRVFLESIGFQSVKETVIYEKPKYYVTMSYIRGNKKLTDLQLKYGTHNNKEYYNYQLKELLSIKKKLNNQTNLIIANKITELNKIIKDI